MLPIYQITDANLLLVVLLEDSPTHDNEYPFCVGGDPDCPCRNDADLVREYIHKPLDNGLLTNSEAIRLYFGTQLTPTQDELTDDEPRITDRRNEWNGYNQEMAWETAEEQWRRATDDRDFEPDDPISDEEIEAIISEPADNKDAEDFADTSKHDWLSEHL